MPTYHANADVAKKGSAQEHILYICRMKSYRPRTSPSELEEARFADLIEIGFGNLPEWAGNDPVAFFRESDRRERSGGNSLRKFRFALPRGPLSMQIAIVKDWCERHLCGQRVHAYVWAIHNPKGRFEDGDQPHVHIAFCERDIDSRELGPDRYFSRFDGRESDRGGYKKIDWSRKEDLYRIRSSVAEITNLHLAANGFVERVTHESHRARGIDDIPERRYFRNLKTLDADVVESRLLRKKLKLLAEDLNISRQAIFRMVDVKHFSEQRVLRLRSIASAAGTSKDRVRTTPESDLPIRTDKFGESSFPRSREERAVSLGSRLTPSIDDHSKDPAAPAPSYVSLSEEVKRRIQDQFGMLAPVKPLAPVDGDNVDEDQGGETDERE